MGESAPDPQGVTEQLPIVFLFVDNCPACDSAKPRVIEFCKARSIPLVVRKPAIGEIKFLAAELRRLPSFPTMLVPLAHEQMVMICGAQAASWLEENEQKVCDGYGLSYSSSNHTNKRLA